ncbi:hypothetical protein [Kingella oralis]|uniref:hypothetical protein n=1 Tax=Kingella oralis TaxID=505 RepID=UPI002D7F6E7A|nr:hypothetical protein [Kingella oralis]
MAEYQTVFLFQAAFDGLRQPENQDVHRWFADIIFFFSCQPANLISGCLWATSRRRSIWV